jgi:ribosome-binding protein aMBF1 (putative translation factor)
MNDHRTSYPGCAAPSGVGRAPTPDVAHPARSGAGRTPASGAAGPVVPEAGPDARHVGQESRPHQGRASVAGIETPPATRTVCPRCAHTGAYVDWRDRFACERCGLFWARRPAPRAWPTGTIPGTACHRLEMGESVVDAVVTEAFGKAIGERVRTAREAAGMVQAGLERFAGVRAATVARMERGDINGVTLHELLWLAAALRCDVRDLLPDVPWAEAPGITQWD